MLASVIEYLSCPHDGSTLSWVSDDPPRAGATIGCETGHRFDVARQGYVNLLTRPAPAAADTAAMVAARLEVVAAGLLQPLTEVLVEVLHEGMREGLHEVLREPFDDGPAAPQHRPAPRGRPPGLVIDVGAGPGHHLAGVVDGLDAAAGLAIDLSKHAARRAARAHARIGAVVADAWGTLPVTDQAADVVLVVFAPRQVAELVRIMRPDGLLVVVTPQPDHLEPLVDDLHLLRAAEDKTEALDRSLTGVAHCVDRRVRRWRRPVTHDQVGSLALMGPSAHHLDVPDLQARIAQLPDPVEVGFAVTASTYRLR